MPKRYRRARDSARRPSSWRRLKQQFKLRRRFQQFKLALIVVVSILLISGVWGIWQFFTEPFKASAGATFQDGYVWDGRAPFNLVVLEVAGADETAPPTERLQVVSLNPTQGRITFVLLPVEFKNLRDLYGLGNLSAGRDGIGRVADEMRDLLGVPIDNYILIDRDGMAKLGELFPEAGGVKDLFSAQNLLKVPALWELSRESARTSLGIVEIARAVFYLAGVRSDKITSLELSPELLNDSATLDRKLAPFFRDEKLAEEHLKIQVLNGSGRPGLAAAATRIIRNLGGEVIRTDNYERQDLEKGYLLLESSGSYTAARLAWVFGVSDSRPPRSGTEARADVTVILGIQNSLSID